MNARMQEIRADVEATRERLLARVATIPETDLSRRREPHGWSVGEVLHHLHLMEVLVTSLLARQVARGREKGIGPDPGGESLLHSLDGFSIETVTDRITAPQSVSPRAGMRKEEVLSLLEASRGQLRKAMDEAADVDLSLLQFPHPVVGRIDMYQWILFVGKHEIRHLGQIERILEGR